MKSRPRHIITALAALAGLASPSPSVIMPINAAPHASITASTSATLSAHRPRRHLPFFNFQTPKNPFRSRIFNHFTLSQRQRRKFNRGRHAAGFKGAFA